MLLPISPKILSATPLMMFQGQTHEAALLAHLKSVDGAQYDLVLMVNRKGEKSPCLYVALESRPPGQPLVLAIYGAKGRTVATLKDGSQPTREKFPGTALFVVKQILQDTLAPTTPPPVSNRTTAEKTLP